MPTDVALPNYKRRLAQDPEAANLLVALLLVPLIFCLGSILLSIESPEFAATIVVMADD